MTTYNIGTCPKCGNEMRGYRTTQCRACYRAGLSNGTRRCMECGGRTSKSAAYMCRPCWELTHPPAPKPVPPKYELDEVAVYRLRTGLPVHANPGERRAAAIELTHIGLTAAQIAERLRVSVRTVERYRSAA